MLGLMRHPDDGVHITHANGRPLSTEQLVSQLKDWCERAEKSGVTPLVEFSHRLRSYA